MGRNVSFIFHAWRRRLHHYQIRTEVRGWRICAAGKPQSPPCPARNSEGFNSCGRVGKSQRQIQHNGVKNIFFVPFLPKYRHKELKTRLINSKKHRDLPVFFWYYRGSNRWKMPVFWLKYGIIGGWIGLICPSNCPPNCPSNSENARFFDKTKCTIFGERSKYGPVFKGCLRSD